MQTKSNKVGGVSWTVRTETGFDIIRKRALLSKVYDPTEKDDTGELDAWYEFIECYTQSSGVITPFEWPSYTTDIDKLRPVRDAWLSLPGEVYRSWKTDVIEVNTPPGSDPDLLPPEDVDPKDLAIPPLSPNETHNGQ